MWRLCAAIVIGLVAMATVNCCRGTASGQEVVDPRLEYNVKAASIYALGRYVTWPDSAFNGPDDPFVIGVFVSNPFGDVLQQIAEKKTLNDRKIQVRLFDSPKDGLECHVVFVPRTAPRERVAELVKVADGQPVLLVGESEGFAERGGIVNFYLSGNNVRFELNAEQGAKAGLSLNAKLLSLGTKAGERR
jgi:hypothetical protein